MALGLIDSKQGGTHASTRGAFIDVNHNDGKSPFRVTPALTFIVANYLDTSWVLERPERQGLEAIN